jgi:hypothetical protein
MKYQDTLENLSLEGKKEKKEDYGLPKYSLFILVQTCT